MAVSAVVMVVFVHLLPEALEALGYPALLLFAAALAAPHWLSGSLRGRLVHADASQRIGLELGFWGLVLHHVGDGVALGAYSRVDEHTGHSHVDVLLALVLHTVPLVAVVSAGYARARGARSALLRALVLAAASVGGILAARLVPQSTLQSAQAYIAAAVGGLLLHGMTHDLGEDLPTTAASRIGDLAAALAGATFGWLGAQLDVHHELHELHEHAGFGASLLQVMMRLALPLTLGLLVGAAWLQLLRRRGKGAWLSGAAAQRGALPAPEPFLLAIVHLGFVAALLVQLLTLVSFVWQRRPASAAPVPVPLPAREQSYWSALTERLDEVAVWALVIAMLAAVMNAGLPSAALSGLSSAIALALVVLFALSLPMHVAAAPILALSLRDHGLPTSAVLLLVLMTPLVLGVDRGKRFTLLALSFAVALVMDRVLQLTPLVPDARLAWLCAAVLLGLVTARVYQLGLRGWLLPLVRQH